MAIDADEVRSDAQELLDAGAHDRLDTMRHSAAHIMAAAVLELFPEAKLGIGPAIRDGFYYDFDLPRALTPADLEAIEERMRAENAAPHPLMHRKPGTRARGSARLEGMMSKLNRCVVMAQRPAPGPVAATTWRVEERPVSDLSDGEVLVRVGYIDVQPAMRGWLNETPAYTTPIAVGDVMRAQGVGEIIASRRTDFAVGEHVHSHLGVQSYCVVRDQPLTRLDLSMAAPHTYLSALGSSGMTAYFGLFDVGQMTAGETVVVSSAAGAVGSLAGQIARLHGCRVIGIAGGPDKCRYLIDELGFDGAVDYKRGDAYAQLAQQCPGGLDIYFDNVGGELLDAAMLLLRKRARIVLSGMISQYNASTPGSGPRFYGMLLVRHARMEGFLAADYLNRYPEARAKIGGWLRDGQVRSKELILEGVDAFPEAFPMLFDGRSFGKLLLRVAHD